MRITPEQLDEWTENPVTIFFREMLERERDEIAQSRGLDAFAPFEPHKTQEIMANLNGFVDAINVVIEALQGDWSSIEEAEDEYRD